MTANANPYSQVAESEQLRLIRDKQRGVQTTLLQLNLSETVGEAIDTDRKKQLEDANEALEDQAKDLEPQGAS